MSSPLIGLPIAPAGPAATPPDDDAIYHFVTDVFRDQINPAVAKHGGKIELIDVQDRTVVVRMKGGCQGCGMATVTLRQGIEASLRKMIPGLAGIRDITDHTAGTKPYYAP
jgi:Fe-S cluster biogenesis protein NfuA